MSGYRVTVDTGGTFSDFVYFNEESGEISITKIPSTPHDPSEAIMQGIHFLFERGVRPEEVNYFCHGTTVATNALLERKGACTGLLVTKGFRGIYEVMEQSRPHGSAIFDVMYDKPLLLVPPSRTGYRLSTTVINAYLQPILERYVRKLEEKFLATGITTPKSYIMQSNGGTSTFSATAKKTVATVLSGPAGGVMACVHLSHQTCVPNLITFDMGGTSCDYLRQYR